MLTLTSLTFLTLLSTTTAPDIHGHRGARAVFPENTLPAFEHALQSGADVLELDVVATKDNQLLIHHDLRVDGARCQGATPAAQQWLDTHRAVRSLTRAQLKGIHCGDKAHPRFPKQKRVAQLTPPTLDELLAFLQRQRHPRAGQVRFNIELKGVPGEPALTPQPAAFVGLLRQTLQRFHVENRTIVQSFDGQLLRETKRQMPQVQTAFLNHASRPDVVSVVRGLDVDIYSPHHLWITKRDVDALHKAGVKVVPWTANTSDHWRRLLHLGVDGIITDDPAALRAFLHLQPTAGASK